MEDLIKPRQSKARIDCYEQSGWKFEYSNESFALENAELDMLSENLQLDAVPSIVFGDNLLRLSCESSNVCLEFTAKDSLLFTNFHVRKNALLDLTKVASTNLKQLASLNHIVYLPGNVPITLLQQSVNQKESNDSDDVPREMPRRDPKLSDICFTSPYQGTFKQISLLSQPLQNHRFLKQEFVSPLKVFQIDPLTKPCVEISEEDIPIHNLTQKNPIKWINSVELWRDELDGCGQTSSEVKARVMGDCWFILLRNVLWIRNGIMRVVDTRLYHTFGSNFILREFQVREESVNSLAQKGISCTNDDSDPTQNNQLIQSLKVILINKDKIVLF